MFVAKAESKIATAVATGGSNVKMDHAVRTVYAKEIEFKALPNMRFYQFATIKTELGKTPGLTIQMLTYDNLKLGKQLTEGTRMTTQALSQSMKSITVHEHGNAVAVSELLLQSSFDDVMASATTLLGRDYALVVDTKLRDTALSGTNVVYGRKKDGSKVSARTELTNECVLNVATIKDAVEILATNNANKYQGQDWICFVHPHQSRSLRDDAHWIQASHYGAPTQLFTGEIGKIDDVRFIVTTLMPSGAAGENELGYVAELKGAGANSIDVYQAVLFGEDYYCLAESLAPEIRTDNTEDFGREVKIAWYGIWGVDVLNPTHGVVIETA